MRIMPSMAKVEVVESRCRPCSGRRRFFMLRRPLPEWRLLSLPQLIRHPHQFTPVHMAQDGIGKRAGRIIG